MDAGTRSFPSFAGTTIDGGDGGGGVFYNATFNPVSQADVGARFQLIERERRDQESRLVGMAALMSRTPADTNTSIIADDPQAMLARLDQYEAMAQTLGMLDNEVRVQVMDPATGQPVWQTMTLRDSIALSRSYYQGQMAEGADFTVGGTFRFDVSADIVGQVSNAALYRASSMDDFTYRFGAKGSGGRIDCSGFIARIGGDLGLDLNVGAAEQIRALERMTGQSAIRHTGDSIQDAFDAGQLRGGMVIGLDTGRHGWDRGRYHGIDHIVMLTEGRDGQLYVVESTSRDGRDGRDGVQTTRFDEWAERAENQGWRMYVTDMSTAVARQHGRGDEATFAARTGGAPTPFA